MTVRVPPFFCQDWGGYYAEINIFAGLSCRKLPLLLVISVQIMAKYKLPVHSSTTATHLKKKTYFVDRLFYLTEINKGQTDKDNQ